MLRKMIEDIPRYLKDFEDVKNICESAWWGIEFLRRDCEKTRKEFWLQSVGGRWENFIPTAQERADKKNFCRAWISYQSVFTLDVLKNYIDAFTTVDYSVEYDAENMRVTLKTTGNNFPDEEERKMIRNLIPMNMDFEVVYVEEV